jgi:hypothetical protein
LNCKRFFDVMRVLICKNCKRACELPPAISTKISDMKFTL